MKFSRSTPEDTLGRDVMEYLGRVAEENKAKRRPKPRHRLNTLTDVNQPMTWKIRGTESDNTPAPKTSSMKEPSLRVSPLLSKLAAAKEGVDFQYDAKGYRVPTTTHLSETVSKWNNFWKTPILSSLVFGAFPAALYWGASKFINPDEEGTEGLVVEKAAEKLIDEDIRAGRPMKSREEYITQAIDNQKRNRNKTALAIWAISSMLSHIPHINPSDWTQLYKYPATLHDKKMEVMRSLRKSGSMLGSSMSFDSLHSSILNNMSLAPNIRESALNALSFNPKPMMTSTDLVNNAIMSGESAKAGLPIGRILTSAAFDGLTGYGLGKLFGVGSPKRLGALTAIGSTILNSLSYN